MRIPRLHAWLLGLLAVSFVVRGWFLSQAKAPWCDEGWFASAAYHLAFHGHSGIANMEPTGFFLDATLPGIQRHTFLVPPLHLWLLAGWYRVFGFGLDATRMYGVVWGAAGLVVIFALVQTVWRRPWLSLLAASLCGIDLVYLWASADGRMDIPAMVSSLAGWLVWLAGRKLDPRRAIALSHCCLAAACLMHLNAVFSLAALWAVILYQDRRRFELRWLALAALPFAAAGAAWLVYIDRHYSDFAAQFLANVRGHSSVGRVSASWQPGLDLFDEVVTRYIAAFGLRPTWLIATPGPYPALLLAYALALFWIFRARGRGRLLVAMCLLQITAYAFLVRFKLHNYLAFLMPLWNLLLAWMLWSLWHGGRSRRFLAVWLGAGCAALQLYAYGWKLEHPARREFHQLTHYLEQGPFSRGARVSGPTYLGFDTGYERFREDLRFGYHTRRQPDVIVLEPFSQTFEEYAFRGEPAVWLYGLRLLREEYREVRHFGPYRVLARKSVRKY